ncbi:MAG TPA: sensor domain-containing diguanylate cyclase [Candidatus Acidoferrum sp.]|nr:sensor domain-containing diguanylate cyclase [Candidatus Acidoferrum sp.]
MPKMENQELYRMVLDSLPVAVCAVDREGKIILWNDGAERVTGYLRQDVLGHLCTDAFLEHADSENNPLEGSALPLLETMRDGKCVTVRASLRKKSGQSVGVHVRTVPLRGDDGRMQGAAELFEEMIKRTPNDRRHNKLAVAGAVDQLTGLLNHSMILAHLQEALSLHKVYPVPFCTLCISIDGVAKIRERFGQAAVDATLHVVAQTLESALRPTDHVGRWLEQEFLAILTECNESDVARVGERLRKMAQRAHVSWWGDTWSVNISIGAAQVQDMDTVGGMVSRAEEGMRKSIADGGNQVVVVTH